MRRDSPAGTVTSLRVVGTVAAPAISASGVIGRWGDSPPTLTENQATGAPLKLSPDDTHPRCSGLATSISITSPGLNTFRSGSIGGKPSTTISVSVQDVTKTGAQDPESDRPNA